MTPTTPQTELDRFVRAFSGQRALITGGAGFIGSHIADALLAAGASVVVLDDLSTGHERNVPQGATLVRGSVVDPQALADSARGCSFVFHQAAMVSVPQSVEQPERCLEVNVLGTQRVLAAAAGAGVRRVLFAASAAAYGAQPELPSRETHEPAPASPYAASKIAGELLLQTASATLGLSTVSLRYFNVYGPRQDPRSAYAAVISAFADALRAGRTPKIFGDGMQTRDFVHVSDVVRANLLAASCPEPLAGRPINIGTGRAVDLRAVLAAMASAAGRSAEPEFHPARAGDVRHSCPDISRARAWLGYEPTVPIERGLATVLGD